MRLSCAVEIGFSARNSEIGFICFDHCARSRHWSWANSHKSCGVQDTLSRGLNLTVLLTVRRNGDETLTHTGTGSMHPDPLHAGLSPDHQAAPEFASFLFTFISSGTELIFFEPFKKLKLSSKLSSTGNRFYLRSFCRAGEKIHCGGLLENVFPPPEKTCAILPDYLLPL